MKTFRPSYMSQSPIPVFQKPRTDSVEIFSIKIGEEVSVLETDILAIDSKTGLPYKSQIKLVMIRYDGRVGFVNKRWLR